MRKRFLGIIAFFSVISHAAAQPKTQTHPGLWIQDESYEEVHKHLASTAFPTDKTIQGERPASSSRDFAWIVNKHLESDELEDEPAMYRTRMGDH